VAGYDLARAFAGSLGVLGLLCEVSLKVPPRPAAVRSLRMSCDEAAAARAVHQWQREPFPVQASAWSAGVLTVRLAGARAAVESAERRLAQDGAQVLEAAPASAFWDTVRDQQLADFTRPLQEDEVLWRLALPPLGPAFPAGAPFLVEWAGGLRWLRSTRPAPELLAAARALGGHARPYRCGAALRASLPYSDLDGVALTLNQRLKASFDPDGVFNRGRLHPTF
jgi:FAD/FMN-containing dehydrogenase